MKSYEELWSEMAHEADEIGLVELPTASLGAPPERPQAVQRYQRAVLNGTVPLLLFALMGVLLNQWGSLALVIFAGCLVSLPFVWLIRSLLPTEVAVRPLWLIPAGLLAGGLAEVSSALTSLLIKEPEVTVHLAVEGTQRSLERFLSPLHLTAYVVVGLFWFLFLPRLRRTLYYLDTKPVARGRRVAGVVALVVVPAGLLAWLALSASWDERHQEWFKEMEGERFASFSQPGLSTLPFSESLINFPTLRLTGMARTASAERERGAIIPRSDRERLGRALAYRLNSLGINNRGYQPLSQLYIRFALNFGFEDYPVLDWPHAGWHLVNALTSLPGSQEELKLRKEELDQLRQAIPTPVEQIDRLVLGLIADQYYEPQPLTDAWGGRDGVRRGLRVLGYDLKLSPTQFEKRFVNKRLLDFWLNLREEMVGLTPEQQRKRLAAEFGPAPHGYPQTLRDKYIHEWVQATSVDKLVPYLETAELVLRLHESFLKTGRYSEVSTDARWEIGIEGERFTIRDQEISSPGNTWKGGK